MNNKLRVGVWSDNKAKETADFYMKSFDSGSIVSEHNMAVELDLGGMILLFINGGPMFQPNPSISFSYACSSLLELEKLYQTLIVGGKIMMPKDKYSWAETYAFIEDKYGVSWQLSFDRNQENTGKIIPSLIFVNENNGKAEQAGALYLGLSEENKMLHMVKYGKDENNTEGHVMYSLIHVFGKELILMDGAGSHNFAFNEGVSLLVVTEDQEETDALWEAFLAGGGTEQQCGWLKDAYGVSWQIVPKQFLDLAGCGDKEVVSKLMQAVYPMKKLIINEFVGAAKR